MVQINSNTAALSGLYGAVQLKVVEAISKNCSCVHATSNTADKWGQVLITSDRDPLES